MAATSCYDGIEYRVVNIRGIKNVILLDDATKAFLLKQGVNMKLLENIGDRDPCEAITAMLASTSKVQLN